MEAYRYTPGGGLQKLATKQDEQSDGTGVRNLMVFSGDFGDRGVRLGPPTYNRESEIIQPLVVLNAPPIHFDVFGTDQFDVAGCFDGVGCDFSAVYEQLTESTFEVQSEVRGDWQIGAGIEAGLNEILGEVPVAGELVGGLLDALGIGVDFSFEASYGEGFSDLVGSSRTITLTSRIETFQEDAIYADVVDYDIWEYPLYVRGRFAGNIAIVLPRPVRDQWFTSNSPEATAYRPNHEPGNLLSYARDLNPSRLARQVFTASKYTLSSTDIFWDVSQETTQFSESSESTTFQMNGDIDIDIPIPSVSVNLNGDYSMETFNTHSTSVTNLEAVTVNLGAINTTLEGKKANYSVTPFVYWDTAGTLVLDYAVDPSIAGIGEVPTWWQERYGQAPDPSLNLPEQFEDLKSGGAVDEATKERTKSLWFFPDEAVPGDEVTVRALIHNYSLLPTTNDVPIRFFMGDPDEGGTAITGTGGVDDPLIPPMEARGTAQASTTFTLPTGLLDSSVRIYAIIDPDGTTTEIHTGNNKGWAPLKMAAATGVEGEGTVTGGRRREAELSPNYPNPFNPRTTISFSLPHPEDVRLAVYDILGREVAVLVDGPQAAGAHRVPFDGGPAGKRAVPLPDAGGRPGHHTEDDVGEVRAGGWWPVAGGRRLKAGGRWPEAEGRWPEAEGASHRHVISTERSEWRDLPGQELPGLVDEIYSASLRQLAEPALSAVERDACLHSQGLVVTEGSRQ